MYPRHDCSFPLSFDRLIGQKRVICAVSRGRATYGTYVERLVGWFVVLLFGFGLVVEFPSFPACLSR